MALDQLDVLGASLPSSNRGSSIAALMGSGGDPSVLGSIQASPTANTGRRALSPAQSQQVFRLLQARRTATSPSGGGGSTDPGIDPSISRNLGFASLAGSLLSPGLGAGLGAAGGLVNLASGIRAGNARQAISGAGQTASAVTGIPAIGAATGIITGAMNPSASQRNREIGQSVSRSITQAVNPVFGAIQGLSQWYGNERDRAKAAFEQTQQRRQSGAFTGAVLPGLVSQLNRFAGGDASALPDLASTAASAIYTAGKTDVGDRTAGSAASAIFRTVAKDPQAYPGFLTQVYNTLWSPGYWGTRDPVGTDPAGVLQAYQQLKTLGAPATDALRAYVAPAIPGAGPIQIQSVSAGLGGTRPGAPDPYRDIRATPTQIGGLPADPNGLVTVMRQTGGNPQQGPVTRQVQVPWDQVTSADIAQAQSQRHGY